ncbi:hypothetical protein GCM10018953_03570 [Streptosporangium nondiastaticum]
MPGPALSPVSVAARRRRPALRQEQRVASASVRAVGRAEREKLRRAGRTAGQVMARRWVGVPAGFKTPETLAPEARPKAGRNQTATTTPAGTPTHRSANHPPTR